MVLPVVTEMDKKREKVAVKSYAKCTIFIIQLVTLKKQKGYTHMNDINTSDIIITLKTTTQSAALPINK